MTGGRRNREDFRFDARYGRLMRKAGIGTVPFALLFYQSELDLSPPEIWLIVYVLAHRWTSDIPYPAIREIERRSGVSKKTIFKYKASLEAKGYLDVVHRTRPDGGNSSIGWDFSPLFERIDDLIMRDVDWWKSRNPQFIDEDPGAGGDLSAVDSNVDKYRPGNQGYTGAGGDGYTRVGGSIYTGPGHRRYTDPDDTATPHVEEEANEDRGERDRNAPVKPFQKKTRTATSNSRQRASSFPLDASAEGTAVERESSLIERIVRDYSARLHDDDKNLRSNCTRARRLWSTSGLDEEDFVALLHEAYRLTQENSHRIRKSAKVGPYGTKNKMPYFFSVLAQLIDDATAAGEDADTE